MYESTLLYSIAFGAFFGLLALRRPVYLLVHAFCPPALRLLLSPFSVVGRYFSDNLVYPTVIHRRDFVERWSCADSLLLFAYVVATGVCVVIPLSGIDQVVTRTGTLSIINLLFCFSGPCLSMLADVLNLSLHSCRRLHASLGTLAVVLAMLHAILAGATTGKLNLQMPKDTFALVVNGGIAAQKLLTEALAEDKLNGQHNLRISIHITGESIEEVDFGSRATVYQGPMPLADILCSERRQRRRGSRTVIAGKFISLQRMKFN
ncbi:hypothetical protein MY8738_009292 [Beauveria namnaoensis]